MTAVGFYLSNAGNDPDMSRAPAVLDDLRAMIDGRAQLMRAEIAEATRTYGDELLSMMLEKLPLLRRGR